MHSRKSVISTTAVEKKPTALFNLNKDLACRSVSIFSKDGDYKEINIPDYPDILSILLKSLNIKSYQNANCAGGECFVIPDRDGPSIEVYPERWEVLERLHLDMNGKTWMRVLRDGKRIGRYWLTTGVSESHYYETCVGLMTVLGYEAFISLK